MIDNIRPIPRGNARTYNYKFTVASTGAALNITGYTLMLTVKKNKDDDYEDAVIKKVVTNHTDPTNGKSKVTLTSTDTLIDRGSYIAYSTLLDTSEEPVTFRIEPFIIIDSEK